ncbi:MAG: glycosyltransferase family 4 protein [Deltaproteobacteria bacterium]|nr:glycosyltransferase family 4 protein [Deltaproteobacteria bacterium]
MRIVLIADSCFDFMTAGVVQIISQAEAFLKLGHEVTLLAPVKTNKEQALALIKKEFPELALEIRCLKYDFRYGFSYLWALRMARIAKNFNADLVISRHLAASFFSAFLARKTIFEIHKSISAYGKFSAIFFNYLKKHRLAKFATISQALLREIAPLLKDVNLSEKIDCFPDGAKQLTGAPESINLDPLNNKTKIGFLGRLYQGKGWKTTLQLADLCPYCDFYLLGIAKEDLKKAGYPNITDNLYALGHIPQYLVGSYLRACDILIAPFENRVFDLSGRDITNFMSPLKIFEYLSCAKPIIVSDLAVLHEILTPNVNALFAEAENINSWKEKIDLLIQDKALASKLTESSRSLFSNNYTWEIRAKNLIKFSEHE